VKLIAGVLRSGIQHTGIDHPERSLAAFAIITATTLAVAARIPVIITASTSANKDQSRFVSDPSLTPQKFSEFIATEVP
jgi:hypothetical protein